MAQPSEESVREWNEMQEDPTKVCPECGAFWGDGANFCGFCGTELEAKE